MEENHMGWKLMRGVRQDVIKLLKLFGSYNSVRYEDFCKVWKEMKFYTIFSCRYVYIERIEFIEELFQIVKEYLSPVYEFHNRVAALYTLYGLYFKQPLREPVKIRLTKTDWDEFQSLIETCKLEKHYDVVFIYLKMLLSNAFIFAATDRTIGLEFGFRKYFKKRYTYLPQHCDMELLYKPLLSENLVSSLVQLEQLYYKKKVELLGKKNIDFIDTNFSVSLQEELKKYSSKNENIKEDGQECSRELSSKESGKERNIGSDQCSSPKNKSNSEREKESSATEEKTLKKKKLTGKYLLAKKKAELYIKQLQEEQEQKDSEPSVFDLPELN